MQAIRPRHWRARGRRRRGRATPPPVLDNLRIDQFATVGAEPGEGAGFGIVPQAAIGGEIGRKNSRKPALDWRPRPSTSEASASCFGCQITPVYWPGGGLAGFSTLQTSIRRPKTVDWPPVGGQTADKFPVPAEAPGRRRGSGSRRRRSGRFCHLKRDPRCSPSLVPLP